MRYFLAWFTSRFKSKWARRYWRENFYRSICPHDGVVVEDMCGQCGAQLARWWERVTTFSTNDYHVIHWSGP